MAAAEGAEPRPWAPVLGPVDRVTFFAEQERHRRSTWRLTALSLLAVVAMGLVVSCLITPLLFGQLTIATGVVGAFLPVPDLFWRALEAYGEVIETMADGLDGTRQVAPARIYLGLAAILVPGVLAMLAIWLGLRALFLRGGVGGVLLAMDAREPRAGDLEEQQLVNVVAEMAIAAGLRPPRVLLLDSDVANAAVVGSSPDDATVVVSRRLLDELDREQIQGVLGHLIGSAGNGDLRVAFSIVSVFQTFGLLMTLLDLPFSLRARGAVWRLVRFALRPPGRDSAGEAEQIGALLAGSLKPEGMDDLLKFMELGEPKGLAQTVVNILKGLRIMLLMPLILANVLGKLLLAIFVLFLTGPLIAFTWRARRYLADATAVKLTRNPDGIARALVELFEKGGVVPGSQYAAHLFVVGTEVAGYRASQAFMQDVEALRRARGGRPNLGNIAAAAGEVMAAQRRYGRATAAAEAGSFSDEHAIIVNFHPAPEKRLKRLRAQGATLQYEGSY